MRPIRIVLVDDHALLREMLGERLQRDDDLEVTASVGDASEAVRLTEETETDVVVLDVDMPGVDCFEVARRIRAARPHVKVLFLSAYRNDAYIERALAVDANGYVTKDEPSEAVVRAIHDVVRGGRFFSPAILARLAKSKDGTLELVNGARSKLSTLTPRETEVLRYIAKGYPKKEIATLMFIGLKTVEKHTENIMAKLDIHDRVGLTRFAIREGIVEP